MASTMALITLNKVLIRDLDFDYAAFVSLLGFTATLLCARRPSRGRFQPAKDAWRRYPGAIVVVAACNSLSAFVGNAVYETTLSFAFIQVVKCFTPVIVLAIGVLVGVERVDSRVAVTVGFVVTGLVICVEGGDERRTPRRGVGARGASPRVSDWRAPSSSCTACDSPCSTASSSCSHPPSSRSPPHSSPRSTKT